jgi:hypothetical protein
MWIISVYIQEMESQLNKNFPKSTSNVWKKYARKYAGKTMTLNE